MAIGLLDAVDALDVVSEALSSPWVDAIALAAYVDGERHVGSDMGPPGSLAECVGVFAANPIHWGAGAVGAIQRRFRSLR